MSRNAVLPWPRLEIRRPAIWKRSCGCSPCSRSVGSCAPSTSAMRVRCSHRLTGGYGSIPWARNRSILARRSSNSTAPFPDAPSAGSSAGCSAPVAGARSSCSSCCSRTGMSKTILSGALRLSSARAGGQSHRRKLSRTLAAYRSSQLSLRRWPPSVQRERESAGDSAVGKAVALGDHGELFLELLASGVDAVHFVDVVGLCRGGELRRVFGQQPHAEQDRVPFGFFGGGRLQLAERGDSAVLDRRDAGRNFRQHLQRLRGRAGDFVQGRVGRFALHRNLLAHRVRRGDQGRGFMWLAAAVAAAAAGCEECREHGSGGNRGETKSF